MYSGNAEHKDFALLLSGGMIGIVRVGQRRGDLGDQRWRWESRSWVGRVVPRIPVGRRVERRRTVLGRRLRRRRAGWQLRLLGEESFLDVGLLLVLLERQDCKP